MRAMRWTMAALAVLLTACAEDTVTDRPCFQISVENYEEALGFDVEVTAVLQDGSTVTRSTTVAPPTLISYRPDDPLPGEATIIFNEAEPGGVRRFVVRLRQSGTTLEEVYTVEGPFPCPTHRYLRIDNDTLTSSAGLSEPFDTVTPGEHLDVVDGGGGDGGGGGDDTVPPDFGLPRSGPVAHGVVNTSGGSVEFTLARIQLDPDGGVDDVDAATQRLDPVTLPSSDRQANQAGWPAPEAAAPDWQLLRLLDFDGPADPPSGILPTYVVVDDGGGNTELTLAPPYLGSIPVRYVRKPQGIDEATAHVVEVQNLAATTINFRLFRQGGSPAFNRGYDIILGPGSLFREWSPTRVSQYNFYDMGQTGFPDYPGDDASLYQRPAGSPFDEVVLGDPSTVEGVVQRYEIRRNDQEPAPAGAVPVRIHLQSLAIP